MQRMGFRFCSPCVSATCAICDAYKQPTNSTTRKYWMENMSHNPSAQKKKSVLSVWRRTTSHFIFLFLCGKSIKSLLFNRHGSHVPFRKIAFKFAHVMCISHFHKFNNHFSHNIFNVHRPCIYPDVRYMGNKPRKYYLLPSWFVIR